MDEDSTEEETFLEKAAQPMRHDRWSVLILAVNWATNVAQATTDTLEAATLAIAQHANQKMYDRKFEQMTERFDG